MEVCSDSIAVTPVKRRFPKRYNVYVLTFFVAVIAYLDRVTMSVAAITMQQEYGWSTSTKGLVIAAFFGGYLIMQVGGGVLANRYGGRTVLAVAVFLWSAFTMLTPVAAMLSLPLLIVMRVALGLGEGPANASVYSMLSSWAPVHERTRAVAFYTSGSTVGALLGLSVTGWFVSQYGWQMLFYYSGLLGFVWLVFWLWGVPDSPVTATDICEKERELLAANADEKNTANKACQGIPWKLILSHSAVWALLITAFCTNWTVLIFVAWLPSYFSEVQGISLTGAGLYSAGPWLTMFIGTNIAAWLADSLLVRGFSVTWVRKAMQSVGLFGVSACLLLVPYAANAEQAVGIMCMATALLAFCWSGCLPAPLEMAPRYAAVLSGLLGAFSMIPGLIGIYITGLLVEQTGSYNAGFMLAAAVSIVGAVIWLLWGTGEKIID